MKKIDYHVLLISFVAFALTVALSPHYVWIILPIAFLQFPVLTRWLDKRRHGDGLAYLLRNESVILLGAFISFVCLKLI